MPRSDPREELRQFLYADYQCLPELEPLAAQSPFVGGHGHLNAPVVLVGEAPGERETVTGRPFTGPFS